MNTRNIIGLVVKRLIEYQTHNRLGGEETDGIPTHSRLGGEETD